MNIMKKIVSKNIIGSLILLLAFGLSSCNNIKKPNQEEPKVQTIDPAELIDEESNSMLAYLNELGDYVNSRKFPSLIKASSVYEKLGEKQLIIDIRERGLFVKGHITKAVNIDFKDIPEYFESTIVPFEYDKIIIVSASGQTSSYTTCILRLMGYGNVYSMRWGMSGWNNDFASENWYKEVGSEHQDKLETILNEKALQQKLPKLNTGKSTGEEILLARVSQLFSEGLDTAHITADKVITASSNYYIMNYIRKDKYDAGHIPGAIRYKPQGTLGIVAQMSTIPKEKELVVYCGTGHNSGFVTAYLRLFGYNAKTLMFGNNSFMHNKMIAERASLSWLPFTKDEVKDYPYTK